MERDARHQSTSARVEQAKSLKARVAERYSLDSPERVDLKRAGDYIEHLNSDEARLNTFLDRLAFQQLLKVSGK